MVMNGSQTEAVVCYSPVIKGDVESFLHQYFGKKGAQSQLHHTLLGNEKCSPLFFYMIHISLPQLLPYVPWTGKLPSEWRKATVAYTLRSTAQSHYCFRCTIKHPFQDLDKSNYLQTQPATCPDSFSHPQWFSMVSKMALSSWALKGCYWQDRRIWVGGHRTQWDECKIAMLGSGHLQWGAALGPCPLLISEHSVKQTRTRGGKRVNHFPSQPSYQSPFTQH